MKKTTKLLALALAVVLEYGGGGFHAAPVLRDVFNLYFSR